MISYTCACAQLAIHEISRILIIILMIDHDIIYMIITDARGTHVAVYSCSYYSPSFKYI